MNTRCLRCSFACSSCERLGPGEGVPDGPAVPLGVGPVKPAAEVHAAASIAASANAIRIGCGRSGLRRIDRRGYQASLDLEDLCPVLPRVTERARSLG